MKNTRALLGMMVLATCVACAQTTGVTPNPNGDAARAEVHIYDPKADAAADIQKALDRAALEGKNVLVQVGGNWCPWCIRLDRLIASNDTIREMIVKNYEFVRVNYSKENTNAAVLARLGYPQRFGFPVLVVLDQYGNRLHTQDSGLLEEGKGHSPEKVLSFLKNWTPAALDPGQYKEQR